MVKISVVIPTYNEEKNIADCIERLNNQSIPRKDFEIIIVDAPSKDKTQEIARKMGVDKIVIQKSKGIGGARNDGFEVAKSDWVATSDCDIHFPRNWLEECIKIRDTKYVGMSGTMKSLETDFSSKMICGTLDMWAKFCNILGQPLMSGTNSVFKKSVWKAVGGYRDLHVNDDVEIGFRMKKKGYKLKFDDKIIVKFSTRRFKKNGIYKTFMTYIKEGLRLVLFNKTKDVGYTQQEYN